MTRLLGEDVEVRRRDEDPAEFLWHGRLYVVREVLARWTETGPWWRSPAVTALSSGDPVAPPAEEPALATAPIPSSPKWAQRAWGEPAPDVGAAVATGAGLDPDEREWWRVEAGTARAAAARVTGVYDLCFAWSSGSWALARVLD